MIVGVKIWEKVVVDRLERGSDLSYIRCLLLVSWLLSSCRVNKSHLNFPIFSSSTTTSTLYPPAGPNIIIIPVKLLLFLLLQLKFWKPTFPHYHTLVYKPVCVLLRLLTVFRGLTRTKKVIKPHTPHPLSPFYCHSHPSLSFIYYNNSRSNSSGGSSEDQSLIRFPNKTWRGIRVKDLV